MCLFKEKYDESDTFTGYKVATKINGKYYSPYTGVEYKVGPVTPVIIGDKRLPNAVFPIIYLQPNKDMYGYTAVFMASDDDHYLMEPDDEDPDIENRVMLKMTISDTLYNGTVNIRKVILGKYIKSIEEI